MWNLLIFNKMNEALINAEKLKKFLKESFSWLVVGIGFLNGLKNLINSGNLNKQPLFGVVKLH